MVAQGRMRGGRVPPLVPRDIPAEVADGAKLRPHGPRRGMDLSCVTRPRTGDSLDLTRKPLGEVLAFLVEFLSS